MFLASVGDVISSTTATVGATLTINAIVVKIITSFTKSQIHNGVEVKLIDIQRNVEQLNTEIAELKGLIESQYH
jgi:hypothetical protein